MPSNLIDNLARWWPAQLNWRHDAIPWLIASLLLGILVWLALWLIFLEKGPEAGRRRFRLQSRPGRLASWLARLGWLVGPGYAALLLGAASPRLMGLTQIAWGPRFGYGAVFVLAAWAVLFFAGLSYRRSSPARRPLWPGTLAGLAGSTRLLLEAGALQWQWSFYRATLIVAAGDLGFAAPESWGVWLAAALIALQGALNPMLWCDLQTPGQAGKRLLRAVLLVASSVLYLLSRNFWLAWALHGVASVLLEPRLDASG